MPTSVTYPFVPAERVSRRVVDRSFFRLTPVPRLLLGVAVVNCTVVFTLLVIFGRGLGISDAFFVSVVLAALVTGPRRGALAGAVAVALFVGAVFAHGQDEETWARVFSTLMCVRLVSFVAAGFAVGYAAARGRRLLNESLVVLDHLLTIAGRDLATAALAGHGLQVAVARRLGAGEPVSLIVGDIAAGGNHGARAEETPRRIASLLSSELETGSELARIGAGRFAVVGAHGEVEAAERAAARYENLLRGAGWPASFGAAVAPDDGMDSLSLLSAAIDRVYGRRLDATGLEPAVSAL